MKKILILALLTTCIFSAKAQIFTDTFDSNTMGWTEMSSPNGEALIKEGVMHLKSKYSLLGALTPNSQVMTNCYLPVDMQKNFELTCDVSVKKIDGFNQIGIIFDCFDEYNYKVFAISNLAGAYSVFKEGALVSKKQNNLKIKDNKDTTLKLKIKSTYNKLEFFVNDMLVIEQRYVELISSGFGFCVFGAQEADFDNLTINQ